MAKITIARCDMAHDDNVEATRPDTTFAVAGKPYSIDLCDRHHEEFMRALAPFLEVATGVVGRGPRERGRRPARAGAGGELRAADLSEEEKEFARSLGWKGRRLSKEIAAKLAERRGAA